MVLDITILAEVIMSYVPDVKKTKLYNVIVSFNYPILEPFRKLQEKLFSGMMIDFSPLLAIIVLNLVKNLLLG